MQTIIEFYLFATDCLKTLIWIIIALVLCLLIIIFFRALEGPDPGISSASLNFAPKPDDGSVIYYRYKENGWVKLKEKIDDFLARESIVQQNIAYV